MRVAWFGVAHDADKDVLTDFTRDPMQTCYVVWPPPPPTPPPHTHTHMSHPTTSTTPRNDRRSKTMAGGVPNISAASYTELRRATQILCHRATTNLSTSARTRGLICTMVQMRTHAARRFEPMIGLVMLRSIAHMPAEYRKCCQCMVRLIP